MIDACIARRACSASCTPRRSSRSGSSTDGKPCDETATWNFEARRPARRVRDHEAPGRGASCTRARRIDAVIVNPTYMFGPRDARPSCGKLIVKVRAAARAGLDARLQQLRRRARRRARHDRGVAEGPARRALHPRRPRHDVRATCFERSRASPACSRRRCGSRTPIAQLVGKWGDLIEKPRQASRSSTRRRSATRTPTSSGSTVDKAARELGYTYGPLEPAIRDALAWFRATRHAVARRSRGRYRGRASSGARKPSMSLARTTERSRSTA